MAKRKGSKLMTQRYIGALALAVGLSAGINAHADSKPKEGKDKTEIKKDSAVEPTSWGKVTGQVYDAKTGLPLTGAIIAVWSDGEYADKGRTVGKTDALGRYRCEAMLGRISSNVDVGRAIMSSGIGLLFGGATNKTKRVDISRLTVRITKEGYTPFEGSALCREVDAQKFEVTLEPVVMTASGSAEQSTVAEGWGPVRITDVVVEPAVLHPGAHATVTVHVQSPPVPHPQDMKVLCFSDLYNFKLLKPAKPEGGMLTYTGAFTVPKSSKPHVEVLTALLAASPYDIAPSANRLQRQALIQVADSDADAKTAALRTEVFHAVQNSENVAAEDKLKALCALPNPDAWDYTELGMVAEAVHDMPAAVTAYKRAGELAPERERLDAASHYATALAGNGEGDKVLSECAPLLDTVKEKERPLKVPVPLMVAIGNADLQANRLDDAAVVSESLLKYPLARRYASVSELRNAVREAKAKAAITQNPGSAAAHVDYGRVLMDTGRWEEAVTELRAGLAADPDQPAAQRDMTYAMLHLKGGDAASQKTLDEALSAAQKDAQPLDKNNKTVKSKDFFAWHTLALLLYSKAMQQQAASDPAASETLVASQNAFREALHCGRAGAGIREGRYSYQLGYTSARVVAITGFAYPEANSDFVILDSLKALRKNPNDYMAQLNLGTALLDLGQPAQAQAPIQKALELKPDLIEARYAAALAALQMGDHDAAAARLRDVLKANPRHPHANLTLAKLLTEDGDSASAAACLADHARFYGVSKDASKE